MKTLFARLFTGILFLFLAVWIAIPVQGFDYMINDFTFYPIPNTSRPPKGVTYQDPIFHTNITRITDAPTDVPGLYTYSMNYSQPGYPKHDIENADGTMLMIQSGRYPIWHIWNANPPYNKIKDFPPLVAIATDPDCRWDSTDPNVLYFTSSSKFYKWNVVTNNLTILHDFRPDFPEVPVSYISTREEGTPSADSRYWAFIIENNDPNNTAVWWQSHFVVYDKDFFGRDNGKIISTLNDTSPLWRGADAITMSPSGNWVVLSDSLVTYPRDFSSVRDLPKCCSHFDFAYDATGREVIVDAQQYYGPTGYVNMGVWARMVDLETAQEFWLAPIIGGQHISGNSYDKPGWALFSIMSPFYPSPVTQWSHHGVFMVELARIANADMDHHSRVWRLATANNVRKGYSDDPYGKINTKGTKVWFGSAWGQAASDPGAQYDTYQIDLPATWYEDLSAPVQSCSSQGGTACASRTTQTCSGSWVYANDTDACCLGSCQDIPTCINNAQITSLCMCGASSHSSGYCCGGVWQATSCTPCTDADGDGYNSISCGGNDCDDSNPSVHPNTAETCNNGIDDNCNSQTDCSEASCYPDPNCCKAEGQSCVTGSCCSGLTCESAALGLPTATASANKLSGPATLSVQFYGNGIDTDGTITSYLWNWGDTFMALSQNASKNYFSPGNYKVVFAVKDNNNFTGSTYLNLQVTGGTSNPPIAIASANPVSGPSPLTVSFTGSGTDSDGTIASYYWNFGYDRLSTSSSQNPVYTYNKPGNYIATLMVRDNSSAYGNAIVNITVTGSNAVCAAGGCLKAEISPCNGCVEMGELNTFIDRWKVSNVDVTLRDLIEAIGLWKKGCS